MKYLRHLLKKKYRVVGIHRNFGQLNDGSKHRSLKTAQAWADHLNARLRVKWSPYAPPWVYEVKEI